MPATLEPIKAFPCTFKNCALSFDTEKERKKHKKNTPQHDYCAKCNIDFECWDDFVAHKADRNSEVHISCLYCGEDFKTDSGRARHIRQNHPTDQEIPCIGCGKIFGRAAALIDHFERGRCTNVTTEQFVSHLQHKNIINKLLNDPDLLSTILPNEFDSVNDPDDGGVKLNTTNDDDDADGEDGRSTVSSLPVGETIVFRERALNQQNLSKLNSDNNSDVGDLGVGLDCLSIRTSEIDKATKTVDKGKGRAEIRHTRTQTYVESTTSLRGSSPGASLFAHTAPPEKKKVRPQATGNANSKVWAGCSSAKLFAKAQKTPITQDWVAALEKRDADSERKTGLNMFRTRFWDPKSKEYDPERFFSPVIEKYVCPFPHCEAKCDTPVDLERHITTAHRMHQVRCPACLKLFKTTAALVAHCEAPNGRCKIATTNQFGQAIDEFSGGFLNAYETMRPDDSDVTFVKYEAWTPPDWNDKAQTTAAVARGSGPA